jgi:hypothetical protein
VGSLDVNNLGDIALEDVEPEESYVFYGQSGSGKTTLAGSFPGPILICDCRDKGTASLEGLKGIRVKKIESWEDAEHVYWYLKTNPTKFKTVVWDTTSQLQQLCIEAVLEEAGKDPETAGEWGVMTKQDFGAVASRMKPFITNFRDLPMNVIFVAQHRTFNLPDEDDIESGTALLAPEVGPALMPSIAKHLNASVSIIANTFIRTRIEEVVTKEVKGKGKHKKTIEHIDEEEHIEYCLRIGPSPIYVTKVRKGKTIKLPDVIVDPTYESIIKALKGKK